jgi:hypothetical protein
MLKGICFEVIKGKSRFFKTRKLHKKEANTPTFSILTSNF